MNWSAEDIEKRFLNGKLGAIALPPEGVPSAFVHVEELLGLKWIESETSATGLAPTMGVQPPCPGGKSPSNTWSYGYLYIRMRESGLAGPSILFWQQERGHGTVCFRDNPELVACVREVAAQEPEPVL